MHFSKLSLLLMFIFFGLSACNQLYGPAFDGQPMAPKLMSFNLDSANNTTVSLSRNVVGKIDHSAGTIILDAPLKQTELAATSLVPSIVASDSGVKITVNGTVVESGVTAYNMDADATLTLEKDGLKKTYTVHVRRWKQIDKIENTTNYTAHIGVDNIDRIYAVYSKVVADVHEFAKLYDSDGSVSSEIQSSYTTQPIVSISSIIDGSIYIINEILGTYYFRGFNGSAFDGVTTGLSSRPLFIKNDKLNPPLSYIVYSPSGPTPYGTFRIYDSASSQYGSDISYDVPGLGEFDMTNNATSDGTAVMGATSTGNLVLSKNILTDSFQVITSDVNTPYKTDMTVQEDNSIYIVYVNTATNLRVIQWDGNAAVSLAFDSSIAVPSTNSFRIASHPEQPYPVLGIINNTTLSIKQWNGTNWLDYGSFSGVNYDAQVRKWLAMDSKGRIVLSYNDGSNNLYIYRYE